MWTQTTDIKQGVAIWNFTGKVECGIPLTIGDAIQIEAETEGWFRGYCISNPTKKGIFPATHVHLIPPRKDSLKNLSPDGGSPITQVVSVVLKEWNAILKTKFLNKELWVEDLRDNMLKLIDYRRQVMSGQLPQEQMREAKADITRCIDWVNMRLELDLVPNVDGDFIDPRACSVVELYKVHLASFEQTKTRKPTIIPTAVVDVGLASQSQSQRLRDSEAFAHHIHFHLKNYALNLGENGEGSEAFFTLFDVDEGRYISERFLARFNKHGSPFDFERLGNITAIFSDISNADLERDIYLTCHVTKLAPLQKPSGKKGTTCYRRPHACGVIGIKELLQLPQGGPQDTKDYEMKMYTIQEKAENEFSSLHENIVRKQTTKIAGSNTANIGISLSLRILHGHLEQLKISKPLLFDKNLVVARKIGFSDYIVPGDLRNDLFVTLRSADLESKSSQIKKNNVEVTFCVVNSKGRKLQCVSLGDGESEKDEYHSVVYRSISNPMWNETVRLGIPIDNFKDTHIRFEFRHCSARKDEKKLFAFAFMRSMKNDGTAVEDGEHELFVYKISEHYLFESPDEYLRLPYCSAEVTRSSVSPLGNEAFSRNLKENFFVRTTVCSTKLTQNIDLRCLLAWREHQHTLRDILRRVTKVGGQDIVVVLQDILDALFSILDLKMEEHGRGAFDALVYIITVLGDTRFKSFTKVMDAYIDNDFSSTFAHKSLVYFLKQIIDNALKEAADFSINMLRSMQYLFKFIFRSHSLFQRATMDAHLGDIQDAIRTLFSSINKLMNQSESQLRGHQMTMLRNFSILSSELQIMYQPEEVSQFLVDMITNMPRDGLPQSILQAKLQCMSGTINSDLFKHQLSRKVLLEPCLEQLKQHIQNKEEYKMCIDILGDILASLHTIGKSESIANEVSIVVRLLLQDTILFLSQLHASDTETNERCIACLLDLLGLMTEDHYREVKESFREKDRHRDFISKLLKLFRTYTERTIYRATWVSMRMRANSLILAASRNLCHDLPSTFLSNEHRDVNLWLHYFRLAVSFITQPCLQLETFTEVKQDRIKGAFGDMRIEMAQEIVQKWTSLGDFKSLFRDMTRPFLEVTMVRESEIRCAILPIIFDIMCCEKMEKGTFDQLEDDLIDKLDTMVCQEKKGDEAYTKYFNNILLERLSSQPWRDEGELFVAKVTRLLERLIDYRQVYDHMATEDDNRHLLLHCILNLMNFYKDDADREDIYTRYIYMLEELHLKGEDYTEAAHSLKVLANNLNWSKRKLKADDKHSDQLEWERKESLYLEIIRLLDRGEAWEFGIPLCKELSEQYEKKLFDYAKLSDILKTQAQFYDNIRQKQRQPEKFFRICFFGNFPQFRKSRQFVYRVKQFDQSLQDRLLDDFPQAKIWNKKNPPEEKDLEDHDQYIEVRLVLPLPDEKELFKGQQVPEKIKSFYTTNEVTSFKFDRPFNRGTKDKENEFKTLWVERTIVRTTEPLPGLLRWVEIEKSDTVEIKPILNAIEAMEEKNKDLQNKVEMCRVDPESNNIQISQALQGTIDAAVQGGTEKYRKAFMTDEYRAEHPDDIGLVFKLEDLIKQQLNICDEGLCLYGEIAIKEMLPLYQLLNGKLAELRKSYGLPVIQRGVSTPPSALNPNTAAQKGSRNTVVGNPVKSYKRATDSQFPMQTNPLLASRIDRLSLMNPSSSNQSTTFYRDLPNNRNLSTITDPSAVITSPSQRHPDDHLPSPPSSPRESPCVSPRESPKGKRKLWATARQSFLPTKSLSQDDLLSNKPQSRSFFHRRRESSTQDRSSTASTSSSDSLANFDAPEPTPAAPPDPPPPQLPERREISPLAEDDSEKSSVHFQALQQMKNQPLTQNHTPSQVIEPPRTHMIKT
ncbi:dedicator of cytokinesis protein 3-like [Amphiura filiformis]|uniref:dedicator of cytokinesis protein 3-like n=1 Tax=Amphiura filiformis TaxID=82378 RepID=UPI003B213EE2